jgi:hypothetical protein
MPDSGILRRMAATSSSGFVDAVMKRVGLWTCVAYLLTVGRAGAQEMPRIPVPDSEGVTTLHVYTNLAQVPVMVLGPNGERLKKEIEPSRFSVSIDSGPWFTATHVRREGDDPIELALLLDLHGNTLPAVPKIEEQIAGLAPNLLHAVDHVTVYGLDCNLTRGPRSVAASRENLERGTELALRGWEMRTKSKPVGRCAEQSGVVRALTAIVRELSIAPGRRVIVAVTDGQDDVNSGDWLNLRNYAQISSVPIYGVVIASAIQLPSYPIRIRRDDPFTSVCDMSGGMVMAIRSPALKETLEGMITKLRDRYIVEFPRPSNSTVGRHTMEVRVEKSKDDFIRISGITMSLPDATVLKDPNTLLVGPSNTPVQGERRRPDDK